MSTLGGHAFAGLVSRIEQVHQAIGGRAFGSIGPVSAPVRVIHDAIARNAYRMVGSAGSAAGALGGQAASLLGASAQPSAAGAVLGVLNAVTGDRLEPDLAPPAHASTSRSPWKRPASMAECITSTCSTTPTSGHRCGTCWDRR